MDWQRTNATFADPVRTFSCGNRTLPSKLLAGNRSGRERGADGPVGKHPGRGSVVHHPCRGNARLDHLSRKVVSSRLLPHSKPRYEFSNGWDPTFRGVPRPHSGGSQRLGLGGVMPYLGLQARVGQRHAAAISLVATHVRRRQSAPSSRCWPARLRTPGCSTGAWPRPGPRPTPARSPLRLTWASRAQTLRQCPGSGHLQGGRNERSSSATGSRAEPQVNRWIADHVALARRSGKRLVAYERPASGRRPWKCSPDQPVHPCEPIRPDGRGVPDLPG